MMLMMTLIEVSHFIAISNRTLPLSKIYNMCLLFCDELFALIFDDKGEMRLRLLLSRMN